MYAFLLPADLLGWLLSKCPDLTPTHAHIIRSTSPLKKITNINNIKHYLQVASVADGGLLVVVSHPYPGQESALLSHSQL